MSDTLYESYTEDANKRFGDIRDGNTWGQTFTIGYSGPNIMHHVTSIKLHLYRNNSPGTLTVQVRTASGDHPTTTVLCSGTINGDTLTTDTAGEWRDITMSPKYVLQEDTQYAIVILCPGGNDLNQPYIEYAWLGTEYEGGRRAYSTDQGLTWATTGGPSQDIIFYEYGNPVNPTTTLSEDIALTETVRKLNSNYRLSESISPVDSLISLESKPVYYYQPSTTSQFTIESGNVLEFSGLSYDDTYLRNNIIVVGTGVSATTSDATSMTTYGYYSFRYEDTNITSSTDAATIAGQILTNYNAPKASGQLKVKGLNNINPRQKFILNLPLLGINNQEFEVIQYVHDVSRKGFFTQINFGTPMWDITREVTNLVKKVY